MNFNLVEMYNGLLRFNKHILNELAEGLKHLPNLDGVYKGDSKEEVFSACIKPDDTRYLGGDKAVRVFLLGGHADNGSGAGSGFFNSLWLRSVSLANVGFFTTVKLD